MIFIQCFQTGEAGEFEVHTVEMFENPTGMGIRNDDAGQGHFGANRRDADGNIRPHTGLDIESVPGQDIVMPFTGTAFETGSGGAGATTTMFLPMPFNIMTQ